MLDSIIYENQSIPGWLPSNDLAMLLTTIQASRAKTYVEIGTYLGKSAAAVSSLPLIEKVVTIDIFNPAMIGKERLNPDKLPSSSEEVLELARKNINFHGKSEKVSIIHARAEDAIEQVRESLIGKTIDFLFVDGEHTSKQVYSIYKQLMSPDGIIAFHDVARPGSRTATKEFDMIRERHNHRIYMKSPRYGSMGFIYLNGIGHSEASV